MQEKILNKRIYQHYRRNDCTVFSEVPFMSRIIDIVLLDKDIITFELKISNWRKSIEQMKEHRIAVDFCYLCVPKQLASPKKIESIIHELKFNGFGLVLWNEQYGGTETILEAQRSKYKNGYCSNRLRSRLRLRA